MDLIKNYFRETAEYIRGRKDIYTINPKFGNGQYYLGDHYLDSEKVLAHEFYPGLSLNKLDLFDEMFLTSAINALHLFYLWLNTVVNLDVLTVYPNTHFRILYPVVEGYKTIVKILESPIRVGSTDGGLEKRIAELELENHQLKDKLAAIKKIGD